MELEIIKFIQSFATPLLDKLFQMITMLGEEYFYVLVLTILYWCVDKKAGLYVSFSLFLSNVINICLKESFHIPRPIGEEGIRSLRVHTAGGFAFPSGHTQATTSFWVSIMKSFKRKYLYITGSILIILVGISRLYLGVHWPKDVIGGIIFGILSVYLTFYILNYTNKNKSYFKLILVFVISIISLIFIINSTYIKAVGILSGTIIGYYLESKYITFSVRAKLSKQIIKLILGIAGVLIVKVILKDIFPKTLGFDFIRYLLIGLWAIAGAPYVFIKLKLSYKNNK